MSSISSKKKKFKRPQRDQGNENCYDNVKVLQQLIRITGSKEAHLFFNRKALNQIGGVVVSPAGNATNLNNGSNHSHNPVKNTNSHICECYKHSAVMVSTRSKK